MGRFPAVPGNRVARVVSICPAPPLRFPAGGAIRPGANAKPPVIRPFRPEKLPEPRVIGGKIA